MKQKELVSWLKLATLDNGSTVEALYTYVLDSLNSKVSDPVISMPQNVGVPSSPATYRASYSRNFVPHE